MQRLLLFGLGAGVFQMLMRLTDAGDCLPLATDHSKYHCFPTSGSTIAEDCTDAHSECSSWARRGECLNNPAYMFPNCRQSCQTCIDGHAGETQVAPETHLLKPVMERLGETVRYLQEFRETRQQQPKQCVNHDPHCTYWAVIGQCEISDEVRTQCGAACQSC